MPISKTVSIVFGMSLGVITAIGSNLAMADTSGSFSGTLTYTSKCRGQQPYVSGTVDAGRVKGTAARGASFDWELKDDGTFGGELFLRTHKRGKKMQWYKGKVEGSQIIFKAEFGVVGFKPSYCYAKGTLDLK